MEETVERSISPGMVALVALLSIGGLLFMGWQHDGGSSPTGDAVTVPYNACCSVEPWASWISGYRQGTVNQNTELCDSIERPQSCCIRAGRNRYKVPVSLIDSKIGSCGPEVAYPYGSSSACCTVQKVGSAPAGTYQYSAVTNTEACAPGEGAGDCCRRAGAERISGRIQVLGAKWGSCGTPEVSYPSAVFGGYTACCSSSSWRQASTGYAQGEAESRTVTCNDFESISQCCVRSTGQMSNYPFKLLGFKLGSCSNVEVNYPVWIR